jgi:hypothetical protein
METSIDYSLERSVIKIGSNMFEVWDLSDDDDTIEIVGDFTEFSYYEEY